MQIMLSKHAHSLCLVVKNPDYQPCFFMAKKSKKNKPFYGIRTKRRVIEDYFYSSASMNELSETHGILGSNTVADWLKKYGNLRPHKFLNHPIMPKPHATNEDKNLRKRRYKIDGQLYLGELEADMETAKQRVRFYALTVDIINELALELTGIDLLKKTGQELSKKPQAQEL